MSGGCSLEGTASFAAAGSEERTGDVPERQPVGGRREAAELRSRAVSNTCVCRLRVFQAEWWNLLICRNRDFTGRGRFLLPHTRPLPEPNPSIANSPLQ